LAGAAFLAGAFFAVAMTISLIKLREIPPLRSAAEIHRVGWCRLMPACYPPQ
jgi:hypothetical protein